MEKFILENLYTILIAVAVWTVPWKGVALWKVAKLNDTKARAYSHFQFILGKVNSGGLAEWTNAPHSKCGWGEIPSQVQILYPPKGKF